MGFLDRAKQTATELAAKADDAMNQAGMGTGSADTREADRLLRNLGVLTYREQSGMPIDTGERENVLSALRQLESQGRLGALTLTPGSAAGQPSPPPPGGMAGQAPPPPGAGPTQPPTPGPGPTQTSSPPVGDESTERPGPPPPPPPPPGGF
ncbi:hypothetical protein [Ornithinicoccus halotolerans]|uniref:hypothetical protein n=1 Tax=Ornithinicoccus halotolerans TaxID=1748220 RepID=UPI001294E4A0|nr:hypothetical protein [Ornithinicoccus halotolerans]